MSTSTDALDRIGCRATTCRTAQELIGAVRDVIWIEPHEAIIARLATGDVVMGPIDSEDLPRGVAYRFLGRWEVHAKHGDRFRFQTYTVETPANRQGTVKYLADLAPNVGKARAEKLWERFGADAVQTLRERPAAIADAGIMPLEAAHEAAAILAANVGLERTKLDLFGLFSGRGFPGTLIKQCIAKWGAKAANRVRRNPYTLLVNDLPGAGFKRCDKLFLDGGGRRDSLKRQCLAAWSALHEDTTGHTWFRSGYAEEAVQRLCVGANVDPIAALVLGKRAGWITTKRDGTPNRVWVAEADKAAKETQLAAAIRALQSTAPQWPAAASLPSELSEHQRSILADALAAPVAILAGTPGTGKTFAAAAIIRAIAERFGIDSIAVAAPTGKAAVRCSASLRAYKLSIEATTVHRLLGVSKQGKSGKGWEFNFHRDCKLPQRFLVIDESSMLDTSLAADLFSACAPGTHILLVGDPYQLPPVGHGAPLRDCIASKLVPVGELSEIRRNSGMIVEACAAIKNARPFKACAAGEADGAERNLEMVEAPAPTEALDQLLKVLHTVRDKGDDPVWDVQVLTAVNERGEVSRTVLNAKLQGLLNPAGAETKLASNPFWVGDKIICTSNGWAVTVEPSPDAGSGGDGDDDWITVKGHDGSAVEAFVANGEIGKVEAITPKSFVARFFAPSRIIRVQVGRKDLDPAPLGMDASASGAGKEDGAKSSNGCDYDLAYAITGHKSQGSEWPTVVVMVDEAGFVASREWVYTAISRGKRMVYLIGKRAVVDKQCKRVALGARKTFLRELLDGELR